MLSLTDALVEPSRHRPLAPFALCQHHFPFAHILLVVITITLPFVWLNTVTVIHLSVTMHPMRDTPILHQVRIWDRYLGPCQHDTSRIGNRSSGTPSPLGRGVALSFLSLAQFHFASVQTSDGGPNLIDVCPSPSNAKCFTTFLSVHSTWTKTCLASR